MSDVIKEKTTPVGPSNRSFGLIVGGIFMLIEGFRYFRSSEIDTAGAILLAISIPLIVLGIVFPKILTPANRAWMKLGLLLHKIVNPVVMFALYVCVICTTGLILRILGKDLLNLKLNKNSRSYWIKRSPTGPSPESMKNQF